MWYAEGGLEARERAGRAKRGTGRCDFSEAEEDIDKTSGPCKAECTRFERGRTDAVSRSGRSGLVRLDIVYHQRFSAFALVLLVAYKISVVRLIDTCDKRMPVTGLGCWMCSIDLIT